MKGEPRKPLEALGDEALEARIVAWVLGEASAFEAAELEERCGGDPDLKRFADRIREMHRLIEEDGKPVTGDEWKLPEGKRRKIVDLLGVESVIRLKKRSFVKRRMILALAACLLATLIALPVFLKRSPIFSESKMIVSYMAPSGAADSELDREFVFPAEYEPPELQNHVAGNTSSDRGGFSATPAMPRISEEEDGRDPFSDKGAQAAPPRDMARITGSGNRSGSGVNTERTSELLSDAPINEVYKTKLSSADESPVDPFADDGDGIELVDRLDSLSKARASKRKGRGSEPSEGLLASNGVPELGEIAGLGRLFNGEATTASAGEKDLNSIEALREERAPVSGRLIRDLSSRFSVGGSVTSGTRVPLDESGLGDVRRIEGPVVTGASSGDVDEMTRSRESDGQMAWFFADRDTKGDAPFAKPEAKNSGGGGGGPRGGTELDLAQAVDFEGFTEFGSQIEDASGRIVKGTIKLQGEMGHMGKLGEVDYDDSAKNALAYLDDPIRSSPALTFEHSKTADEVRRDLYTAEGNYNLGKFDQAKGKYEEVLGKDPYNTAARRGLEKVAAEKASYYRAAYDNSRAELLMEVDRAWEEAVPAKQAELGGDDSLASAERRLKKLKKKVGAAVAQTRPALGLGKANSPQGELEELREAVQKQEVSASDNAYSTFSMHVSDASFKLAAAAMERGEVPAAESVRPEEFYNAFDYGDPAPTANEPVACAVEQCAHPAFPQRNLLRIAVRTGAEGRAQSVPLNLTLLLDNSGSMEREDRARGLSQAVAGLSSLLKEGDTVTVAGFSRQPRLLADRIDGKDGVTLNGLVDQTPAEGGTNLEEALKLGGDLAKRQFKEGAQNRVVLFTDGAANLGDADPESLNRKVEQLRNEGIAFDAAGFGADGLNDRLLERLTRNGNGRYYIVDDENDADEGFAKQLAGAFRPAAENVKVQVVFNPSRVGNYKLIGFEEHRLKKEDFRNDSVDAAEMASEEAGVALYQFEILPEGQGEVGEVSVRFRDTSSGEMVERTWPIPYDPQASSFDQAKPGLQLAGIAAFVAEKLRGAPLAEAVDYSQLRGVMGRVKAEYSGNQRVIQLEKMMRDLK